MADWLHLVLRFLHYGALLGLFGLTAYRAGGLRNVDTGSVTGPMVGMLVAGAVLAPILSAALMLVGIGGMMGQSPSQLEPATIEAMIVSTDMGWAFSARMALLLAALATIVLWGRSQSGFWVAAIFYGLALLTLGWSGHAAATEGTFGLFHRLNNWAHLLAAGLWIGAIGWFVMLTYEAHRAAGRIAPYPLLNALHRFALLGVTLVAVTALTGLLNSHFIFGLGTLFETLQTEYGKWLAAKLALVAAMLICGARNAAITRLWLRSSLRLSGSGVSALRSLRTSLAIELLMAAAVIIAVANLGLSSPMG